MSDNWNITPESVKKNCPVEDPTVEKWDVVGWSVNSCGGIE
jgi:hypothetical protein